jgi:hypothetical protein
MKLPGYILAFYILLLAVIPCCAFDDCPDDKTQTEQTADHEAGDEDCGTCSPFFNCSSCTSVSSPSHVEMFTISSWFSKKVYAGYILPSIPNTSKEFWQPPKLRA